MKILYKIGSYIGTFNLGAYTYMAVHHIDVAPEKWVSMLLLTIVFLVVSNLKEK
jgi:hypothetical protein